MSDLKKQLSIALTEPVVFLRTSDPSGRHSTELNDPPALVRAILTLNVVKPIAISTIEVELSGILSINYAEAIGSRRVDLPEKHRVFSSTVTVFRSDKAFRARHSVSVGPGLSTANSNQDEHRAITSSRAPSLPRGRPERRNVASVPLDLGPTPPYTEVESPIQSTPGIPGDHPAQTLQPLRLDPRDSTTESHEHGDSSMPSSSRSHISFSLPDAQSDPSITSNDSSHQEVDSLGGDLVHTIPSLEDGTTLHTSAEEALRGPSPNPPFRAHSPESTHGTRPRSRGNSHDTTMTSNSRLRLSLTYVLDAVKEITSGTPSRPRSTARFEEQERGRSRVRSTREEQGRTGVPEVDEGIASPGHSGQVGPHGHSEHREHHLLGLGRILGLGRDHEKEKDGEQREQGENWREFRPGTYSFPISFLLPPHLPPTFSVPNGSLNYTIKAVAHRPGTFTSKLSCHVPLLIVAAPAGDGAGDPGPISVQQQWRGKLAYSLALSSRLFLLGSQRRLEAAADQSVCTDTESLAPAARVEAVYGAATLDLTLLPIEKIKIWSLDIYMDQHVKYFGERGQPCRDEDKKQLKLMELHDMCTVEEMSLIDEEQLHKDKHKHQLDHLRIPLLPTPISPHRSPLLRHLPPSTDSSVLAGPGPYPLSVNIGLPGCNDPSGGDSEGLHFTVRQKGSSVKVEHFLRLTMRVEYLGDSGSNEGEKKLFDVAIQTPVTILSCRCVPEYLPRYSQSTEDSLRDIAMCACQENVAGPSVQVYDHDVSSHYGQDVTPSSASSYDSENGAVHERRSGHERSRSPSHARRDIYASSPTPSRYSHPPSPATWASDAGSTRSPSHTTHSHEQGHRHAHSQSLSVPLSHVYTGTDSQLSPPSSPRHSRPPSPLTRYERLVSGLESEAGEAPPSYESVTSRP